MLELENFGVVEMSSQEIQEVDGGNWMEFFLPISRSLGSSNRRI